MAGAERWATAYRQYTIRRLLKLPLVILLVSIIVFVISRLGGSPAGIYISHNMTPEQIAQVYERYHLNDPIWEQYFIWLWSVVRGDLGWSGVAAAPVSEVLFKKGPR